MKIIDIDDAARLIPDNVTVSIIGSGGDVMTPEAIFAAIEKRFFETGNPNNITLVHSSGIGDQDKKGISRFAHHGMVKKVIGGHWGWSPKMQKMALDEDIDAYNLPQGAICSLFREIAAKRPGLITKVGLKTFVDPDLQGGTLNDRSPNNVVEKIEIDNEEWLRYKTFPIDVAIIRGTVADLNGNISMEMEAAEFEVLAQAEAAHNSGGIVICQVKHVTETGTLDPMLVKIPGIFVDYVVVVEDQKQTEEAEYNPSFRGQFRPPLDTLVNMPLNHRKVIARRAAMELSKDTIVNLGFGMPDGVATVASEEGLIEDITLSIEQGIVGGIPAQGAIFGVSFNPEAIINAPAIFDFYSGNGLDTTCLGFAQVDKKGNVNVSKFGTTIAGCGGFIDISQSAKKIVYCGTLTSGGLKTIVKNGEIQIIQEGKNIKFIPEVEQITYSGAYGNQYSQKVIYVTERAVFELRPEGLTLIEIAPGIDVEKDVVENMGFVPLISESLRTMDKRIFIDELMCISTIDEDSNQ